MKHLQEDVKMDDSHSNRITTLETQMHQLTQDMQSFQHVTAKQQQVLQQQVTAIDSKVDAQHQALNHMLDTKLESRWPGSSTSSRRDRSHMSDYSLLSQSTGPFWQGQPQLVAVVPFVMGSALRGSCTPGATEDPGHQWSINWMLESDRIAQ